MLMAKIATMKTFRHFPVLARAIFPFTTRKPEDNQDLSGIFGAVRTLESPPTITKPEILQNVTGRIQCLKNCLEGLNAASKRMREGIHQKPVQRRATAFRGPKTPSLIKSREIGKTSPSNFDFEQKGLQEPPRSGLK